MSHEYYLDCVECYMSHVLAKFLIVGRALCTKNQSHEYYLECAFFTNWSRVYYFDNLYYLALKSTLDTALIFSKGLACSAQEVVPTADKTSNIEPLILLL